MLDDMSCLYCDSHPSSPVIHRTEMRSVTWGVLVVCIHLSQIIMVIKNLLDLKDFPSPVSILLLFLSSRLFSVKILAFLSPPPFLLHFFKG